MLIKIKGFQTVLDMDAYTDRSTLLPGLPGVIYDTTRQGQPSTPTTLGEIGPLSFKYLKNIKSPVGPLIFAKSLTGHTSIEVPSGTVTVLTPVAQLMQYTYYNIWHNSLVETSRTWAYNLAWDRVEHYCCTVAQLAADTGLVLTTTGNDEWANRITLAQSTPEERYAWRVENPPSTAPNIDGVYRVPETVLVLDADYWYPFKVKFTIDNIA